MSCHLLPGRKTAPSVTGACLTASVCASAVSGSQSVRPSVRRKRERKIRAGGGGNERAAALVPSISLLFSAVVPCGRARRLHGGSRRKRRINHLERVSTLLKRERKGRRTSWRGESQHPHCRSFFDLIGNLTQEATCLPTILLSREREKEERRSSEGELTNLCTTVSSQVRNGRDSKVQYEHLAK